jgi:Fe-Mn family superoxide dismutase
MTQHTLISLPYNKDALSPYISPETISYHYDKHHRTYLNNLNNLLEDLPNDSPLRDMDLKSLLTFSYGKNELLGIFNNAAQVINHDFYWLSIKPNGGDEINDCEVLDMIQSQFGSLENFKSEFVKIGLSQFGSGWVWLTQDSTTKKLAIMKTSNADNPILYGHIPLMTCDVWEHAYYIDYRNKRNDYIQVFLDKMVNWNFADKNLIK